MATAVARVSAGVPTGGQFAERQRAEAEVTLPTAARFGFDEEVIGVFTEGDCWRLALVLHQRTGYPVVPVSVEAAADWYHAGVQLPSGRILDIEGVHEEQDWLERWANHVDWGDYDPELGLDVTAVPWADGDFEQLMRTQQSEAHYDYLDAAEWADKALIEAGIAAHKPGVSTPSPSAQRINAETTLDLEAPGWRNDPAAEAIQAELDKLHDNDVVDVLDIERDAEGQITELHGMILRMDGDDTEFAFQVQAA